MFNEKWCNLVCVRAMLACVRACVHACVRACVRVVRMPWEIFMQCLHRRKRTSNCCSVTVLSLLGNRVVCLDNYLSLLGFDSDPGVIPDNHGQVEGYGWGGNLKQGT